MNRSLSLVIRHTQRQGVQPARVSINRGSPIVCTFCEVRLSIQSPAIGFSSEKSQAVDVYGIPLLAKNARSGVPHSVQVCQGKQVPHRAWRPVRNDIPVFEFVSLTICGGGVFSVGGGSRLRGIFRGGGCLGDRLRRGRRGPCGGLRGRGLELDTRCLCPGLLRPGNQPLTGDRACVCPSS